MDIPPYEQEPSSYRDPSGFIFKVNKTFYRQVNKCFQKDFEAFISSGLYDVLVKEKLLLSHTAVNENLTGSAEWFTTLQPEQLAFISYPYEWSFLVLKEAALHTLEIALKALEHGMVLKDASAYNLQIYRGRMVFIDTLSFEIYKEGEPWIAYRQFCEHFLGPLALMHYCNLPMQALQMAYPDGIPLAYVKKMLPYKSRFNLNLYLHIHLHSSFSTAKKGDGKAVFLSKQKLINLIKSLQSTIGALQFESAKNTWGGYYEEAATRAGYLEEKKSTVSGMLVNLSSLKSVIDVGGNNGEFARLVATEGRTVICADGEHYAIDSLYKSLKEEGRKNIYPVVIDFSNPSPPVGVNNTERKSFLSRSSCDLAMALALVHHLAIGKNITFDLIAKMLLQLGNYLLIEFVPKEDEKVQLMLKYKKDIYNWYSEEKFVISFTAYYHIMDSCRLTTSSRTLYLMKRL